MKSKILILCVCCLSLGIVGCVSTLDGKSQAGFPLVSDTLDRVYDRPFDQVWKACRDTLTYNGKLTVENAIGKNLEGKVQERTVWILVEPISPKQTRMKIQVRTKGGGTDNELATDLREEVSVRLASNNMIPATQPAKPAATTN